MLWWWWGALLRGAPTLDRSHSRAPRRPLNHDIRTARCMHREECHVQPHPGSLRKHQAVPQLTIPPRLLEVQDEDPLGLAGMGGGAANVLRLVLTL